MELEACNCFEWAQQHPLTPTRPFPSCRHNVFGSGIEQTLGLPVHLLNHNLLETTESPNCNEEIPDRPHWSMRAGSIPVEQIREETLWPQHASENDQQQQPLIHQSTWQSASTGTEPTSETQYNSAAEANSIPQPVVDPIPKKRKRGRPRLYATLSYEQSSEPSTDMTLYLRKSHLEKNRIAAEKSRRRRKDHTSGLTSNASALTARNGELKAEEVALREELLDLKNEVLRHADCSSSAIDGYIAVAVRKLGEVAPRHTLSRKDSSHSTSPDRCNKTPEELVTGQGPEAPSNFIGPNSPAAMAGGDLFRLMNEFLDTEELAGWSF